MPDNVTRLETEIAADREHLAETLDGLSKSIDPERISQSVASSVHEYGGEIGRQAWAMAKENPAAFALVGTGIALLLTGTGREKNGAVPTKTAQTPAPRRSTTAPTHEIGKAARMRRFIDSGLDRLPPQARKRVRKAREAAVVAQERVEAGARRAAGATSDAMATQPLAIGGLALGFGALLGSLLPGTEQENRALGAKRDAMMKRAEHILEEEWEALREQGETALRRGVQRGSDAVRDTIS